MLYHLFLNTMNFLYYTFGYAWAIRIKLILLALTGGTVAMFISIWLAVDFFLNVEINPLLKPLAVLVAPTEDNPKYTANPKNIKEAIEVFFRYQLMKRFHKKDIAYSRLRLILRIYTLLVFIVLFFAILLSCWVYVPPSGGISSV